MRVTALVVAAVALAACSRESDDAAGDNTAANSAAAAAPAPRGSADSPSFDCARADGQAQELVCSDKELAAMDREAARLERILATDTSADPSIASLHQSSRQVWAAERDACWKADELRQCVGDSYARRIAEIRSISAAARASAEGLSLGPVAFSCGQGNARTALNATFINSDPGAVVLQGVGPGSLVPPGRPVTLGRAVAASGARYEQVVDGQPWVFWNKGREATLTIPGKPDASCAETAAGADAGAP
jgi:uncharacterized protein